MSLRAEFQTFAQEAYRQNARALIFVVAML